MTRIKVWWIEFEFELKSNQVKTVQWNSVHFILLHWKLRSVKKFDILHIETIDIKAKALLTDSWITSSKCGIWNKKKIHRLIFFTHLLYVIRWICVTYSLLFFFLFIRFRGRCHYSTTEYYHCVLEKTTRNCENICITTTTILTRPPMI